MGGALSPFFFSSRRRHTRFDCDWSSDVCSSDLTQQHVRQARMRRDTRQLAPVGGDAAGAVQCAETLEQIPRDRKSTRLNSSHSQISYAVFCLKKKKIATMSIPE